jgi:uncharacterized protein YjdB
MKPSLSIIISFAIILSGCCKEEISQQQQKREEAETEVQLILDACTEVKATDVTEYFKNMHIFVFDTSGHKIFHSYQTLFYSYPARANYGINHFAVIINAGDTPQFDIDSLPQLYNLVQEEKYGTDDNFTFTGLATCFISPMYKRANVRIERSMAKFTCIFDKSNLDPGVTVDITRIQLRNIPETTYLFKENKPTSTSQFQRYGPYIVYNNLEPDSHENATPLYMYENMQGTLGNNSDPDQKHPGEHAPLCSFIMIRADYSSPQKSGVVEYYHYPGGNNTNNYDIVRNHHYRETIVFSGDALGEAVRTDSSSLQPRAYQITLSANPPEGGTTSGGGEYQYGILPDLSAEPSSGYQFTGWVPDISPVTASCHYTANFELIPPPDTTYISSITLCAPDSVLIGESVTATTEIIPQDATEKSVIWSSSNPSSATIDQSGIITTLSAGETIITVSSTDGSGVTAQKNIIIYDLPNPEIPVSGIYLDNTNLSVITGEIIQLSATVTPSDATNKEVTWQSSCPEVATVNSVGQIEAVAPGITTITASASEESYQAHCVVNVYTHIHVEPKTHIINQYDQYTHQIIQSDIVIYLRAQIPSPSDMQIINAIAGEISVDVTYTYTVNNHPINGFGTLTLDPVQNNDHPQTRTGGNIILITLSGPMNEAEILNAYETLTITPIHGDKHIDNWFITW